MLNIKYAGLKATACLLFSLYFQQQQMRRLIRMSLSIYVIMLTIKGES